MTAAPLPRLHRQVLLAAGLMIIAAGLHAAAATVNLVLVSLLVAMSVSPIPYLLTKRGLRHGTAVLLTVLAAVAGGVLLIGALAGALSGLQEKLPTYQAAMASLFGDLNARLAARGVSVNSFLTPDPERIVTVAQHLVRGALSALGYGLFALILVALILIELPQRPEGDGKAGDARSRFEQVSLGVRRFVALTGLVGAGQSAVNLLVMLALGTDFALVWGVLFFLLSFVPFGFAIGLLPPLAVTLLEQGPTKAAVLVGVLLVANLVSDNVVKPKVMGQSLGLSPLVIVLSLLGWGYVLGAVGALLAVPLTITMTTLAGDEPSGLGATN